MSRDTVAGVFEQARARFRSEKAGSASGTCEFSLTGTGGGVWSVEVRDGNFTATEAPRPDADVRVIVPADLFVRLANGDADGFSAFATGKLRVEGDRDLAYRLSGLFFE